MSLLATSTSSPWFLASKPTEYHEDSFGDCHLARSAPPLFFFLEKRLRDSQERQAKVRV